MYTITIIITIIIACITIIAIITTMRLMIAY